MNNHLRGERHVCPFCELKFYDLNRSKLECPRCKNEIIIESLIKKPIASKNPFSQKTNLKDKPTDKDSMKEVLDENIDDELETEDDTSTIVNIDE
tara:strand:+ start:1569 stop:1853 length:285 start_codon:yes stop_codon:yes gene_type:complete